jgi:cell division protein FtsW (lipid II flippase)
MKERNWFIRIAAVAALFALRPDVAQACAVCFGKSDSALAKGMNWGIFTLLFFIIGTLAVLSGFFVFLAVRSRHARSGDVLASFESQDNPAHS